MFKDIQISDQQQGEISFKSMTPKLAEINDEIRENCRKLCSDYLSGPWQDLRLDELLVVPIGDGLSNRIYACTNLKLLVSTESTLKSEVPNKVLIRLYGSSQENDQGSMEIVSKAAQTIIVERLHQKQLAPKIYGVFKEGRIEHYIESIKFPQETWNNIDLNDCLMRKMAEIHQLEMPISKDSWPVFKLAEKLYQRGLAENQFLSIDLYEQRYKPLVKKVIEYDHIGTGKWLKDMALYIKSPTVFCHNDLHFGNILDRNDSNSLDDRVFIIDYDNCSYGARAYDFAFFFAVKSVIPGRVETWAGQKITTREEKRRLLKVYLDHLVKIRNGNIDPMTDTFDHLEREADWGDVFIQYLRVSMFISLIKPSLDRIQFCSLIFKESDIEVELSKERCDLYKQTIQTSSL